MTELSIRHAESNDEIAKCYSVMRELRPHLDESAFILQVQRQRENGRYRLVFIEEDGAVVTVAGYRTNEMLAWGMVLYVDDLVTRESDQGKGYGSRMLDWLVGEARHLGCDQFHLDSGVQRFDAHRFYLHKGMDITAHHFALVLPRN